jgi:uncharacterized protein YecT (DUF1311 family)
MALRLLALTAILLGGGAVARADPPAPPAPAPSPLQACLANDTPSEGGLDHVTACYKAAFERVDGKLAAEYQALEARLKAKHVTAPALVEGQRAWRLYRDKWCAFEGLGEADAEARASTELMCRVEVTQAQLDRLRYAYQR